VYYIIAISEESAWEKIAVWFPEEVNVGFTVTEWSGFNVKVVEVKTNENVLE